MIIQMFARIISFKLYTVLLSLMYFLKDDLTDTDIVSKLVIKRGQDGLMEEGLSSRNNITTTCRRFTRSMTMARQKEISLCSDNDASDDEVQQDHLEQRECPERR